MNDNYEQLTVKDVTSYVASLTIIFGGIIPYIPQYREIKRKRDAEGFSLYVCLTLLIANTLRILFWFGKHYETPLLIQSIIMIITMFIMIKLSVNIHNRSQIIKLKERVFTDLETRFFWKWTDFQSYLDFMLLFAIMGGILMYWFIDVPIFVEIVGFLAVLIEAMLGIPQFLRNFYNKSTSGMSNLLYNFSITMVSMWTLGDLFKTCYFVLREAPIQFENTSMHPQVITRAD
ncbi:solute carrier family 66 member 2 isoform X3 [Vespa velutina]|uniref:solute carrier family 66 member 2 isoform X3 n=1 Tax=Vespa velutina TaxID=202808 RepID=UPI001FB22B1D|nr:solute carrier family 66 member 2 isoform X3 [Vespa velutina]